MHLGIVMLVVVGSLLSWMGIVYLRMKRITPESVWDNTTNEPLEVGPCEGPYRILYAQRVQFRYSDVEYDFSKKRSQELEARVIGCKGKLVAYFENGKLTRWTNGKEGYSQNSPWFTMGVHQMKVDCLESTLGRVQGAIFLKTRQEEGARAKA